jgi:hypothetical protein
MTQPLSQFGIHSCDFCSIRKIDPKVLTIDHYSIVKYDGPRVSHGASQGCAFFQHILDRLVSERSYDFHDGFELDLWVYVLLVYVRDNKDSRIALGDWRHTLDGISASIETFFILALPSK